MTPFNDDKTKQVYFSPQIECIQLDNEIALQLSSPAISTEDEVMNSNENVLNNPFKTEIA